MIFAVSAVVFVALDCYFSGFRFYKANKANKNEKLLKYIRVANNFYDIYNLLFVGMLVNWISNGLTLNICFVLLFVIGMYIVIAFIKYNFEVGKNNMSKSSWWCSLIKDILANCGVAFAVNIFTNNPLPTRISIIAIVVSLAVYICLLKKSKL